MFLVEFQQSSCQVASSQEMEEAFIPLNQLEI